MKNPKPAFLICLLCSVCCTETALADVYAGRIGFALNGHANMITRFGDMQSGDTTPVGLLGGMDTQLQGCFDIFYDATEREFFVADYSGAAVRVFSQNASGNTAPIREVSGDLIDLPLNVLVINAHDELVILKDTGVSTVPRNSNGHVIPTRFFGKGAETQINFIKGMVYSPATDELFIGNLAEPSSGNFVPEVLVFPRISNGPVPPSRKISGNLTGFGSQIIDLAINPTANELYVLSEAASSDDPWLLQTFPLNATGNVAPTRSIVGIPAQLKSPTAMAYDSVADQFVLTGNNLFQKYPTLLFLSRTANGSMAPVKVISGSNTGMSDQGDTAWVSVVVVDQNLLFKDGFE